MDVATGKETATLEIPSALASLAVSSDGKYVAAVPSIRAAVPIIDTATHLQRPDSLVYGQYSSFAFSTDGMSLAVAREATRSGKHESEIMIGRRMDPSFVRPIVPEVLVSSLAFSPEGDYVAAAGGNSIVVYHTEVAPRVGANTFCQRRSHRRACRRGEIRSCVRKQIQHL